MGKLEILQKFGESAKVKTFDFSNKGSTDTILLVVGAIVVALIIALIASALMKK